MCLVFLEVPSRAAIDLPAEESVCTVSEGFEKNEVNSFVRLMKYKPSDVPLQIVYGVVVRVTFG